MNQLIKTITQDDGTVAVCGRELHQFLEVETPFKKWFDRMTEYGFEAGKDFAEVLDKIVQNPQGGRPSTDYAMTLDMAKEVAMIQRTEKGKQARQYFLEVEKRFKQGQLDMTGLSPQTQAALQTAQALANNERRINQVSHKVDAISDIVATSTMDWRNTTKNLIHRIAHVREDDYKVTQHDIFADVDRRGGVALSVRLTNLRNRMAGEGASKTKQRQTSKVDVIENDKKLIEIYTAVVKDHAIKYRVWDNEY